MLHVKIYKKVQAEARSLDPDSFHYTRQLNVRQETVPKAGRDIHLLIIIRFQSEQPSFCVIPAQAQLVLLCFTLFCFTDIDFFFLEMGGKTLYQQNDYNLLYCGGHNISEVCL